MRWKTSNATVSQTPGVTSTRSSHTPTCPAFTQILYAPTQSMETHVAGVFVDAASRKTRNSGTVAALTVVTMNTLRLRTERSTNAPRTIWPYVMGFEPASESLETMLRPVAPLRRPLDPTVKEPSVDADDVHNVDVADHDSKFCNTRE
jgi:hypothetical protein